MLVENGMTLGLGTGTTVAFLLPALARRSLDVRCVATSPRTQAAAHDLGLRVDALDGIDRLDLAIDGADQIAPDGWLVKGGGGAHSPREGGGRGRGTLRGDRRFIQTSGIAAPAGPTGVAGVRAGGHPAADRTGLADATFPAARMGE